ncbi:hypothetical protein CA13_51330 [Planctomycetes bacterium CA13]|uniref:Uncharacterized protein n=1 Tax=Novipirellula herctigrandis TaxID=2527986 RepID=A0A5C5Z9B0_9BACT|nr:hypothetical protein CA13_51330 [Planctomycetes bacterium CA13]
MSVVEEGVATKTQGNVLVALRLAAEEMKADFRRVQKAVNEESDFNAEHNIQTASGLSARFPWNQFRVFPLQRS